MKDFIKTWWHCLVRLPTIFCGGEVHRMAYYRPAGTWKREYFCSCSERFKEVIKDFELTN